MTARPVVGVLCCNEVASRAVQVVASRFVEPLSMLADATVLLVPAMAEASDIAHLSLLLDGLLLTGSRSHVAPHRYRGSASLPDRALDEDRDEVALRLGERMIGLGKPVFGICRGLQEINVLFGGTLCSPDDGPRHHSGAWGQPYESLFDHCHDVRLVAGGTLERATGAAQLTVNSVHEQCVDRLGADLRIEALAVDDGVVEAFSARQGGADVLGVQWHPEWDAHRSTASRAFFALMGQSMRAASLRRGIAHPRFAAPASPHRGALRGH